VDGRTDIFSLGVVLYEMIAGRRPFVGVTATHVLVSILEKDPPPLSQHSPAVPAELERMVTKALRKNREERYQVIKDLLIDLKNLQQELGSGKREPAFTAGTKRGAGHLVSRITSHKRAVMLTFAILIIAAVASAYFSVDRTAIESVAVLPFTHDSADPDTEYLADGITESIISNLSQLSDLKVMSRTSVFRYKGRNVDPQVAGGELNVQSVLAGRLVARGDELAISVELIDLRDNSQLWGEQYSQKIGDLLHVQGEISRKVSDKLRLRLSGAEQQQLDRHFTKSAEAYQLYLRGRFWGNKFTEDGLTKAIEHFHQALQKDPDYALAYVGLADTYIVLGAEHLSPREAMPKATAYAKKALELNPGLAEAHAASGIIKLVYDWDWQGAEKELSFSRALSSQAVESFSCSLHYADVLGRNDEAIAALRSALELDPLSLPTNLELGCASYYGRHYDQAIRQFQETLTIYPDHPALVYGIGRAYGQKKMYAEAIAQLSKMKTASGDWPPIVSELGYAYAASGKRPEAQKLLQELSEQAAGRYVDPYLFAVVNMGLGEKDQTFAWLDKAVDGRSGWLPWLKVEPKWDSLRADPRFAGLLRRVGLPL
jgi:TolB-like protein/Flp pilus assembly protein TadD